MKLTVLGCAGTYPGADSGCSSYLVEHEGFRMMVDCGFGAVGALQRYGDLLDVDAVVLSHLHADHCIDLVAYAYARGYHPDHEPPTLPVYGPTGTADRIGRALETPPPAWLADVYDWRELGPEDLEVGPFHLEPRRMAHPIECYGLRIGAAGRVLSYSADTGPCDALVELACGADLFLSEASFVETRNNPEGVHLTGYQAGQSATEGGAESLLLTHLVAWYDENQVLAEGRAAYSGEVRLARAGAVYEV